MTSLWSATWRLVRYLTPGGQGTAQLVERITNPDEKAVIKSLHERWWENAQARQRMKDEVETLLKLQGTAARVPVIIESNVDAKEPYFIMSYVDGISFDSIFKKGHAFDISYEDAIAITMDLANTVEVCHQSKIIHRDLKPSNLILSTVRPPKVVVLDFGISFDSQQTVALTKDGEVFWNEFLRLPECQDSENYGRTEATDITALSGILYYLLTKAYPIILLDGKGKMPHQRTAYTSAMNQYDFRKKVLIGRLFDKAFQTELEYRVRSISVFKSILSDLGNATDEAPTMDLQSEVDQLRQSMLKENARAIQELLIKKFGTIQQALNTQLGVINNVLSPAGGKMSAESGNSFENLKVMPPQSPYNQEDLKMVPSVFTTYFDHLSPRSIVYTCLVMNGKNIDFCLQRTTRSGKGEDPVITAPWRVIYSLNQATSDSTIKTDAAEVVRIFEQEIACGVHEIKNQTM
jgi:eukaryotic-like serine/threonine-protein kinase